MVREFYDLKTRDIHKNLIKMSDYKDHVVLIVAMASNIDRFNDLTMLEKLCSNLKDQRLEVLLFPTDQLDEKETLRSTELDHALHQALAIDLPLMEKVDVKGDTKHPIFSYLTEGKFKMFKNDVKRNFTMFVVSRTGEIVKRLNHDVNYESLYNIIEPYLEESV